MIHLLHILLLIFSISAQANGSMLKNKYQLSTEAQLDTNYSPDINAFWNKHAQTKKFESTVGGTINTVHIRTGQPNAIVFSQGRNESVLKYKELAFDLSQQGYDVFLIDHRGQGFSTRLGGDAYRGHVEEFEDYITDLNDFIISLNLPQHYESRFLLSHSMGGAISALYLEEYQHPFQAAAFFSPMFSINLGGLPIFIAKVITYVSDQICRWFSNFACYAPGSNIYQETPFENNKLTSSTKRYASAFDTFNQVSETQLGGATMRWVNKSLYASEKAVNNTANITIPTLIVQAGSDSIVTADGQENFIGNSHCKDTQLLRIDNAKHEIFLEQDKYRIPAITATLDFFKQSQQGKLTCIK